MEKITPEWIAEQRKVCAKANEQIFSHEKVRAENAIVYELFAAALDTLEAALAENDRLKTPRQKKQNYCTAPMDYRAGARCASIAASGICNYPRETCQYQNERGDNELISEIARLTAERDAAVKDLSRSRNCCYCAVAERNGGPKDTCKACKWERRGPCALHGDEKGV